MADGPVRAAALSGNTYYLGGSFTQVGPFTGLGVPLDAATGMPVGGFPRVTNNTVVAGLVSAAVPDGSGGWYIGGTFTEVGGVPRNNIAHILADNTVSPWNPDANGRVAALGVSGGTVYVGGDFTMIGGQPRNCIAALDAGAGHATGWNPNANTSVRDLVVSGSTVYAGGDFTVIGGQSRSKIAALDAGTGLATGWNPSANGDIYALAVGGSTVYAGGFFTSIGGQPRSFIAALDAGGSGQADPAWDPNADASVRVVTVSGSRVYVGGQFANIGGQARNRIAALDAVTGLADPSWNPDASGSTGTVLAIAVSGATVYAGGDFTTIGGQARNFIAALDASTGLATAWNPNANNYATTLVVSGSTVYAGGVFIAVGSRMRNRIAALDATTGLPTAWNPDANADVHALAVSGSTVYASGLFTGIGGQPRDKIAALDAATGLATLFQSNTNGAIKALAANASTVYAGGEFTSIGGQPRNRIAALDATSGLATPWDPNSNGEVSALALSGSLIYAGGDFTSIGVQPRNRIAALDTTSGQATPWDPNSNGEVSALALSGSMGYVGGNFTSIGGESRNHIAALSTATALATTWNPDANGAVSTLVVRGSLVLADGDFTTVAGLPQRGATIDGFCPPSLNPNDASATLDSPEATVLGDFDGDGLVDVALAVAAGAQVLRNLGDDLFGSWAFESTGGAGRGIAASDFNDDFVLDLALSTSDGLHIMMGGNLNGAPTGSFDAPVTYPVGTNPSGISVADFNEDGINDLAVAVTGTDSVVVLLGEGSVGRAHGSFGVPTRYSVGDAPLSPVVSDFNADGIWDLVVTNSGSAGISVLLGQGTGGAGNGGFAPAVSYAVGAGPRPIVTGDFNEDGITDIAVGCDAGVSVLRGQGAGTFATAVSYPLAGSVRDLAMADFDVTGRADLAVTLGADGTVQYFYGNGIGTIGDGSFQTGPTILIGGYLSTLEVNIFDPQDVDPAPLVVRRDQHQLVTLDSGCPGGIARSVELTSPNGGGTWLLGSQVPIQWTRSPLVIAVNVEISRDGGARWERIASNLTGTEFQWTVVPPGTTQGRIRVVDAHMSSLSDASNGTFAIDPLVGVHSSELPAQPSFSLAYPNPSRGDALFELRLPVESQVTVEVFDLAGRRVRRLAGGPYTAGTHTLAWDGREREGRQAANGIYFVRARTAGLEAVRRVVRIE